MIHMSIVFQSNAKLKLVRSLAVCEESSGPFNDGPPESVTIFYPLKSKLWTSSGCLYF